MNLSLLIALALSWGLPLLWFLLLRLLPNLLKPGQGPLWSLAALLHLLLSLSVILLCQFLGEESLGLRLSAWFRVAASGPGAVTTQLSLALALLIALALLLHLPFRLLRGDGHRRPPFPKLFLLAGVAPDGSPLQRFRGAMFWLTLLLLSLSPFALLWLGPQEDPSLWSFPQASLTGLLLGFIHPSLPLSLRKKRDDISPAPLLSRRLARLHEWLGQPEPLEHLPAVPALREHPPLLGLEPYAFQRRLYSKPPQAGVLYGPEGSGKSSAALMLAARLCLERGGSCLFLMVTVAQAESLAAQATARLAQSSAALALKIQAGPPLEGADLYLLSLGQLERLLESQRNLSASPALRQIRALFIEDLEEFSGVEISQLRFLLHRLLTASSHEPLKLLSCGLGREAAQEAARCVLAEEPEPQPTPAQIQRWAAAQALSGFNATCLLPRG